MKELSLTKGFTTVVDDDDYEELSHFKWYVVGHPGKEYAARYGGKHQHIRLHRELLHAPANMEVDHINGNRLDNRSANLRLATRAENGRNRAKFNCSTLSEYKGVTWHSRDKRWQSTIVVDGRHIHLGYFMTEREAALAYNKAAVQHFGIYANLNNIEEDK